MLCVCEKENPIDQQIFKHAKNMAAVGRSPTQCQGSILPYNPFKNIGSENRISKVLPGSRKYGRITVQSHLLYKNVQLTSFLRSGLQPVMRMLRQVWLCPFWQERWRGVKPPLFLMYTLPRFRHSRCTVRLYPFQAASCSAVFPYYKQRRSLADQKTTISGPS